MPGVATTASPIDNRHVTWRCGEVAIAPDRRRCILMAAGLIPVGRRASGRRAVIANVAECLGQMPEISRFLGIVIRMYFRDHRPPHFHAEYGEHEITVDIDSGIVQGRFPRRALTAVLDWYNLHQDGLARNWELIQTRQPLNPIEPLE